MPLTRDDILSVLTPAQEMLLLDLLEAGDGGEPLVGSRWLVAGSLSRLGLVETPDTDSRLTELGQAVAERLP